MVSKEKCKVFIIIVSYQGKKWLKESLNSCKEYKTVVVDNNSKDGTVRLIEENFQDVALLKISENLGFGKANNLGIDYALKNGADYVFLLNQDAYLQPGCIEKLIEVHTAKSNYGILSPIHLNGKGSRLDKMFSIYLDYNGNPDFYSDFLLEKQIQEVYEVPFVNAAGWLISRECIEKVGGFDPIFHHYGEDENYCQRVLYHGMQIGVVPSAFIYHDREERELKERKKNLSEHFIQLERDLKIKYANINSKYSDKLRKVLNRRKSSRLKSILKFNLKDYSYYKKETEILNKIIPEIEESRRINRMKGHSYLNEK